MSMPSPGPRPHPARNPCRTVPALTPVAPDLRRHVCGLPATAEEHARVLAGLPAFGEVEVGGDVASPAGDGVLRVAAWNLERCLHPERAAALLRRHGAGLALLSEMDLGVRRTGNRHTVREVASRLGHRYAFGPEFLELAAMPAPIAFPDNPAGNRLGFHGNALTACLPFRDPVAIPLPEEFLWFAHGTGAGEHEPGQKRVGARMALAATFRHAGHEFVGCSVHLESRSDFAGRARQMGHLLDALDEVAGGLPVVVGGDLNTHVGAGGHDDARELLFAQARARGYDWAGCNLAQPTTRPSTWSKGAGLRQLDWFCTRGVRASAPEVVPALDGDGTVLSDHDLILVSLDLG